MLPTISADFTPIAPRTLSRTRRPDSRLSSQAERNVIAENVARRRSPDTIVIINLLKKI